MSKRCESNISAVDISFMDTEPMDEEDDLVQRKSRSSVSSTRHQQKQMADNDEDRDSDTTMSTMRDGNSGDEEDGDTDDAVDTEPVVAEELSGSDADNENGVNHDSDDSMEVEELSGCESDESEDVPVPSFIDITFNHQIKRIYSDLIDSCRGFEDGIPTHDSEKILKENITAGEALCRQMENSMSATRNSTSSQSQSQQSNSNSQRRRSEIVGNSASEMYAGLLHTRTCGKMLKQKAKSLGVITSSFSINEFLEVLRSANTNDEGVYSSKLAAKKLAFTVGTIGRIGPRFKSLFGAFDITAKAKPPPPKEKKQRATRKKEENDDGPTQTEIVNKSQHSHAQENECDTPQGLAEDILKVVKSRYKEDNAPQSLLDITYASSIPEFVSRVFGVAFVVRDGHLGIDRREDASQAENSSALVLKPQKPPRKKSDDDVEQHRNQTIVSISSSFLKTITKPNFKL